jgi:hypothetical protein
MTAAIAITIQIQVAIESPFVVQATHARTRESLSPGPELDRELAIERVCDALEGVDPGRAAAALEPRDRRLRRATELGELHLGEAELASPFGYLVGNLREEPTLLGAGEAFANSLDRVSLLTLTHIADLVYSR